MKIEPSTLLNHFHRFFRIIHVSMTELVELVIFPSGDIVVLWYGSKEKSRGRNAPPAA